MVVLSVPKIQIMSDNFNSLVKDEDYSIIEHDKGFAFKCHNERAKQIINKTLTDFCNQLLLSVGGNPLTSMISSKSD